MFYRQGPADLMMPGTPHNTSVPEKPFTVKDGTRVNSEREGINSILILTASFTVNIFSGRR